MIERVRRQWQMLRHRQQSLPSETRVFLLRCASTAALVLVGLAILLGGEVILRLVVLVFVMLAGREWVRLAPDREDRNSILLPLALGLLVLAEFFIEERALLLLPLFLPITLLGQGRNSHHDFVGLVCLACTGVAALVLFRTFGKLGLAWTICVVSAFDIFAYLCGRTFRGAKLWPSVSPNKRWAGLIGGLIAAIAVSTLWAWLGTWLGTSLGASLATPKGEAEFWWARVLFYALAGLGVALGAQAGDLAESQLKRLAGVKDSGSLLPGQGGLLDRLDSLIGALPIALIALFLEQRFL